jgi:hypothetical protein
MGLSKPAEFDRFCDAGDEFRATVVVTETRQSFEIWG